MSNYKNDDYCDAYTPMSTEKLLEAMGNSYIFNYSCANCVQCVECGKCNKHKAAH